MSWEVGQTVWHSRPNQEAEAGGGTQASPWVEVFEFPAVPVTALSCISLSGGLQGGCQVTWAASWTQGFTRVIAWDLSNSPMRHTSFPSANSDR